MLDPPTEADLCYGECYIPHRSFREGCDLSEERQCLQADSIVVNVVRSQQRRTPGVEYVVSAASTEQCSRAKVLCQSRLVLLRLNFS